MFVARVLRRQRYDDRIVNVRRRVNANQSVSLGKACQGVSNFQFFMAAFDVASNCPSVSG